MINTMIFDLDGTLVQTERLKAQSYAKAAVELCPQELEETAVIEAFKDVVGLSRKEVATSLMERFELTEKSRTQMDAFGVDKPWQAYVQVRLNIYEEMLADPDTLRNNRWPHALDLLTVAREQCRFVALATMSHCEQVQHVLQVLDLQSSFDFVATRDDVENGKPNPEIYQLVAEELGVASESCLVIEDSPTGVRAALNAGMHVLAVGTPFTKERLYEAELLPADRIVDRLEQLTAVARRLIQDINTSTST